MEMYRVKQYGGIILTLTVIGLLAIGGIILFFWLLGFLGVEIRTFIN